MGRKNKNEKVIDDINRLLTAEVSLSTLPNWLAKIEYIENKYCPVRKMFQRVYSLLDSDEIAYNKSNAEAKAFFDKRFSGKEQELMDLVSEAKEELQDVCAEISGFNKRCKADFLKYGPR